MVDIRLDTTGTFKPDKFSMASTSANNFYPFYSQFVKNNIHANVSLYCKPNFEIYYNITRYNELFEAFADQLETLAFHFEMDNVSHFIHVSKGIITDHLKRTLFVLTVNDFKNCIKESYDPWEYEPDYSKFKLFVATDFITNPIYKNIWRKLDKDYVQKCYELGIVVEFTTADKIDKQVFDNEFKLNFSNMIELQNHLKNDVTPLLFTDITADVETPGINSEAIEVVMDEPWYEQAVDIREGTPGIVQQIQERGNVYQSETLQNADEEMVVPTPRVVNESELADSINDVSNTLDLPQEVFTDFLNNYYAQNVVYSNIIRFEIDNNNVIAVVTEDMVYTQFINREDFIRFANMDEVEQIETPTEVEVEPQQDNVSFEFIDDSVEESVEESVNEEQDPLPW